MNSLENSIKVWRYFLILIFISSFQSDVVFFYQLYKKKDEVKSLSQTQKDRMFTTNSKQVNRLQMRLLSKNRQD